MFMGGEPLIVARDLNTQNPIWFVQAKGTYNIEGSCLHCGKCCVDCKHLSKKNLCKIEDDKPWWCRDFPATRDPDNPLSSECGYKIVKVDV
jgi:hypothetical protein